MRVLQQLLRSKSWAPIIVSLAIISCGANQSISEACHRATLLAYTTSPNLEAALSQLTPDYRLYFGDRSGEEDVTEILTWDHALHPAQKFTDLRAVGDTITAIAHEENDFTQLFEIPGWETRVTYIFDNSHLIVEQLRAIHGETHNYRDWLKPAVEWLLENQPDELEVLYPNESLQHSAASAQNWLELLTAWREVTGRDRLLLRQ